MLGGSERRGSYYHDEVTTRQSVAMVTDDPEHKKKLKSDLAGAFAEDGKIVIFFPMIRISLEVFKVKPLKQCSLV